MLSYARKLYNWWYPPQQAEPIQHEEIIVDLPESGMHKKAITIGNGMGNHIVITSKDFNLNEFDSYDITATRMDVNFNTVTLYRATGTVSNLEKLAKQETVFQIMPDLAINMATLDS